MKKTIAFITGLLISYVFCSNLLLSAFGINFENANSIQLNEKRIISAYSEDDYQLLSFTAPEDGYYLFEALGKKRSVFSKYYSEPIITLYDSNGNELQYAEFDFYEPEYNTEPYAKIVHKLKENEIYYLKTEILNFDICNHYIADNCNKYTVRVIKAPQLVFTYIPEYLDSGYYELFSCTGPSKELTIESEYTVSEKDSLFVSPFKNVPLNIIGLWSCKENEHLEILTISDGIICIASEAFFNCKNLNTVKLGKDITTIGYKAFAGCESLKSITIDSDNIVLEPQCLGYDEEGNKYSDFTIICHKGSKADSYAQSNGINTVYIKNEPITTSGTVKTTPAPKQKTSANKTTNAAIQVKKPKVKKAVIKKITKTSGKKQLKVKWKKLNNVSGYQIKCGLNKKMTKGKKIVLTKTNCKSKIIKGLKSKRKYYVKIRAYKTYKSSNGKVLKAYGKWSKIKKSKTK